MKVVKVRCFHISTNEDLCTEVQRKVYFRQCYWWNSICLDTCA